MAPCYQWKRCLPIKNSIFKFWDNPGWTCSTTNSLTSWGMISSEPYIISQTTLQMDQIFILNKHLFSLDDRTWTIWIIIYAVENHPIILSPCNESLNIICIYITVIYIVSVGLPLEIWRWSGYIGLLIARFLPAQGNATSAMTRVKSSIQLQISSPSSA